jgi:membrane-bound lytic murein transglycosylase D
MRRPVPPFPAGLYVLAVLAWVGACSHDKVVPPELAGVYERIHESREDFEIGVELILAGDDLAGENHLAAATTRIVVAARECAQTPGCDVSLANDALEQILAERRWALQNAAPAISGEPAVVDPETVEDEPFDDSGPLGALSEESLLTGVELERLIPMNPHVKAALNDWLTWNRPGLMEAHRNYTFLRPDVAPIYADAALPEALLFAMMAKESGGKVHAYSSAGAAGPLQFMGRTGLRYGLGSVDGFDMRLDPVAATKANAAYMIHLLETFNGNLELALAAYNVGETRLRRLCQKQGRTDFWDPAIYYALPWETRNYVPKVLAAAWLFLRPEEHNLRLPAFEATATTVVLEEDASLGELSVCLGQFKNLDGWFRTLRNLNPRVSPGERMPGGTELELPTSLVPVYSERCVGEASLILLARELHDADYPEKPEVMEYTVRSGDTLAAIATRHRCSLRELANLNSVKGPDYVIHIGQRLTVPTRG